MNHVASQTSCIWIQSSMTEKSLNNCLVLHAYKELMEKLNLFSMAIYS